MKKKNYLTVIVQPDWKAKGKSVRPSRTFEIPTRIFYYIAVAIVLLAIFGINGSDTATRNITLRKKLRLLESSVANLRTLERRVDTMCAEERIIRNFVGYEEGEDSEEAQSMGKGGVPEDGQLIISSQVPENVDAQLAIEEMDQEKPLHLRVCDLQDNLHGLSTYILTKNKNLNYLPSIMPVKNSDLWITSNFGWRRSPFTRMREFHNGLDISGKRGAPIIATADGTVVRSEFENSYGNIVTVKHRRYTTSYAHMLNRKVTVGQKVTRGQILGLMGSTGRSTGYHVHYIVEDNGRTVNPSDYILNRSEIAFSPGIAEDRLN